MTTILRAALLIVFAAASTPLVAAGQDTSTTSLVRRIERLERANAELERRVVELESQLKNGPAQGQPVLVSTRWRDLSNWRQLRIGMRPEAVRTLLGEPERVDGGFVAFWRWGEANVAFIDDKVSSWSEPER